MAKTKSYNRLETNRKVILHYYEEGYRCAVEIARITKIPVRTVRRNLAKRKKQGSVERHRGSGRPSKLVAEDNVAIGQWIRRNEDITAKELTSKLLEHKGKEISTRTMQRHLHDTSYEYVLPKLPLC